MNRGQRMGLILVALLLFACNFATGTLQELSETSVTIVEDEVAVGAAPVLMVDNFAGNIAIEVGESGTVRVVARRHARLARSEDIEVQIEERGGRLVVETIRPANMDDTSVDLDITAPANTRVEASTGGGNVQLSGLTAEVTSQSGGGDIRIENVSGNVNAETGGGSITIRDAGGEVVVSTGGGNIEVAGGQGLIQANTGGGSITVDASGGTIEVSTGGGDIDVRNDSGQITARTSGGNVRYYGGLEGECTLETSGGDIRIELPADAGVEVDLEVPQSCNDCRVEVDFDVEGQVSEHEVRGAIGSGDGALLRAHTSGGDIILARQ